jgi:hypothetical protein
MKTSKFSDAQKAFIIKQGEGRRAAPDHSLGRAQL